MPSDSGVTSSRNNVLDVTLQNTSLNGGTHGDHLVRVHAFVWFFAEKLGHFFDHFRHPGHTTDENDFVDFIGGKARVLQCSLDRASSRI